MYILGPHLRRYEAEFRADQPNGQGALAPGSGQWVLAGFGMVVVASAGFGAAKFRRWNSSLFTAGLRHQRRHILGR